MNNKSIILTVFTAISILATSITFTPLVFGQGLKFTLFDIYAPALGVPAVMIVSIAGFLLHQTFNLATVLHVFPVMFGAWYFSSKNKFVNLIPAIAIIGFMIHPIGREVWYYSLFWMIPIIASRYKNRSILVNSLGAAFTTHAVGGLLWIYAFNPPASVWQSLIPIVIMERAIFAFGTAGVYMLIQKLIHLTHAIPAHQNPPVSPA